jgi:hypothetical protein
MESIVYAEIESMGCYATLWLNDVPLFSAGRFGVRMSHGTVRHFSWPGHNKLELFVEPVPKPSDARTERRKLRLTDAWASARLVRYEDGVMANVENGEVLLDLRYKSDGAEEEFPVHVEESVALPDALHHWGWESAEPLSVDEPLMHEASALLDTIADVIRSGDVGAFMALSATKIQDADKAYPAGASSRVDQVAGFIEQWHRAPDCVLPLDASAHDFRVVGGGRLLETVDTDGRASLRFREPTTGGIAPFRMFLAKLNGKLQVVR